LATNSLAYNEDDLLAVSEDEVTLSGPAFKFRGRGMLLDVANNRAVFKKSVSSKIKNMRDLPQFSIMGS
ncbi:MAG: LPS export ABC transporter periplasmic protein LptC, partial [Desulfarculus sp.]|nr:LPS export ABC transporter periplasmic protein LptC [Desulfarculus sp.]